MRQWGHSRRVSPVRGRVLTHGLNLDKRSIVSKLEAIHMGCMRGLFCCGNHFGLAVISHGPIDIQAFCPHPQPTSLSLSLGIQQSKEGFSLQVGQLGALEPGQTGLDHVHDKRSALEFDIAMPITDITHFDGLKSNRLFKNQLFEKGLGLLTQLQGIVAEANGQGWCFQASNPQSIDKAFLDLDIYPIPIENLDDFAIPPLDTLV